MGSTSLNCPLANRGGVCQKASCDDAAAPKCVLGAAGGFACALVCPTGTMDCGGTCADLASDSQNCGGCAMPCAAGTTCSGGQCLCSATSGCGGCCSSATTCVLVASQTSASCGTGGGACGGCTGGKACLKGACAVQLTVTGIALSATKGVPFSGPIATVTDAIASDSASALTAMIDWGDSTTSRGTITGSSGTFEVTADHTFSVPGIGTVTIVVRDATTGAMATTTAGVSVAPLLTVSGGPITATAGLPLTGVVANLTDGLVSDTPTALSASINWGDGSGATFASISGQSGNFTVDATHTYAAAGPYTATVAVSDTIPGNGTSATLMVTVRPASTITEYTVPTAQSYPAGIAAGADANLWFTEYYTNKIGRLTTAALAAPSPAAS